MIICARLMTTSLLDRKTDIPFDDIQLYKRTEHVAYNIQIKRVSQQKCSLKLK